MWTLRYVLLATAAIFLATNIPICAQINMPTNIAPPSSYRPPDAGSGAIYGGYMVGIGDILDIHVNDEDAVSGRYQVDQSGNVTLPLLTGATHAAGSTTFDLASRLTAELKKQQILQEPSVTVLIVRGMTQNASILGAVMKPGTYPIEKNTTLLDLISLAGGLAPNAGGTLTISHNMSTASTALVNASATSGATPGTVVASISVTNLMSGKDPRANVEVRPGDMITISTAPIVFVVGAVTRAGAFSVQDPKSRMTVLQALAMAEGTTSTAALNHAIIIRQTDGDTDRKEIPLDLKKIIRGKDKDEVLEANDILFVPQSGLKASMHTMGQMGAQTAASTLGYGLGLRIAP